MYKYFCLNPISPVGLEKFSDDYVPAGEMAGADAVLVRSAGMHELEFDKDLKAIARAGAGVNNIPLDKCAEQGIVVFNTPGANANGVKELVIAGMLLASRDILGGINWVQENEEDGNIAKDAEKAKKAFAGCEIQGKKLGVIGLGAIGVLVANAATHLGMEVYGYDPYVSVDSAWRLSRSIHHTKNVDEIYKEGELTRLKENIAQMRAEIEEERRDTESTLRQIKKEEREAKEELKELKQGRKAYPKELEEARLELQNRLQENCGKFVSVQILADLLEIRDERWHNAVEGYMGNNKLLLIVEPKYAKAAMDIYQEMDKKKFFRAAILDTEKVMEEEHIVRQGALAEEVKAKEKYVQSYINFFLGNVMKCENIEELRECRIGVTPDCMLYHSYRLQHINPENYTRRAYIGEISLRQRIRQLQKHCDELQEKRLPLAALVEEAKKLLELEAMSLPTEDYISQILDAKAIKGKETRKKDLLEKLQKLRAESVDTLEAQMKEVQERRDAKQKEITKTEKEIWKNGEEIEKFRNSITESEFALSGIQKEFQENERFEKQFEEYLEAQKSRNYIYLKEASARQLQQLGKKKEEIYQELVAARSAYTKKYTQRNFSVVEEDNKVYQELLESLSCDNLETYRQAANEQAKAAVEHFKDDFVFKIRSAIREAYQRRDELNRIISRLDFGKDKYQFVITKNKGADGKYYKMFMDDTLQINPAQLSGSIENQMNLFTMEHEENYGDMMNELIGIFIPPENATHEELEEAKKNMDKYADYRTYLSFDMQQIVQGEEDMKIGLGKMIRKNSGGEGQNPLYVALLASFAQIYRINLSPKIHRNPTLRLVVLDEAFSKMDAEKVASCIALIRGLGFQAIISATNDKIQNYLENVDKTFVYANPNKRHISIQEFEKTEFAQLADEEEQG